MEWTLVAMNINPKPRMKHASTTDGQNLYIIGGYNYYYKKEYVPSILHMFKG